DAGARPCPENSATTVGPNADRRPFLSVMKPARTAGRSSMRRLPREVGERLVRLGHAVGVLAGAHGLALAAIGSHQLFGEPIGHGSSPALAAGIDQPAERQALLPALVDLHRHLVV